MSTSKDYFIYSTLLEADTIIYVGWSPGVLPTVANLFIHSNFTTPGDSNLFMYSTLVNCC